MKARRLFLAAIVIAATALPVALAGAAETGAGETATAKAAKKTTTVRLQKSRYGRVLFDNRGGVLYLFTADTGKTSNCYGDCAKAWPPFYARGKLRGIDGVIRRKLGRTTRTDGRKQVTYAGHPLYYYVHDGRNQILCHDVFEFGGDWLVVRRSGKPAP